MSHIDNSAMNTLNPSQFPLHSSRLIEASAGTGKTYTIAALYLRLVLGHGTTRCYTPDELLVVTFTEPATEELRDRIRANLSEAAAYFRGDITATDDFLINLKADFPAAEHAHYGRLLDLAAQAMDEAAVHTIHGWCNRMLREHAFASGSLFTQQLNTDTAAQWEQVSRDYWRTFVSVLSEHEFTQYQLMSAEFADPNQLLQAARGILTHTGNVSVPNPAAIMQQHAAAQQQLRARFHTYNWLTWADECEQILSQLRDQKLLNGQKLQARSVSQWFEQIRTWARQLDQPQAPLLPEFKPASAWQKLNPEDLAENSLKTALPDHPLWQTLADLKRAHDAIPSPRHGLLQHAAQWLQQRFAALQKQRAEMGFDDMLTRLKAALYGEFGEALATTIRQQFPIAMVDEFQDTDPVQYAIFDRIYRIAQTPDNVGVFLIGDPKQAIYSFRNADIHTYLKARRATTGRHYTLGKNYRSTTAMVAASNALFLQAQDAPRGPFHFKDTASNDDPLPFLPVSANGLKTEWLVQGLRPAALQFDCFTATEANDKQSLHWHLAQWQAEQIVQLLNDAETGFLKAGQLNRVQPGDIAILVNKASEAKIVREALRERGLQSVYLSDRDSVFASTLAIELLRVLQACAQPRDPSLLRAALLSRLLNRTLQQIDETLNHELLWDAFAERILSYHERWQRQGILAMVQRLMHDYNVPAQLLQQHDGERQLTDLLHLAELLQQQAATSEGMAGLIRYLSDHIELAQQANNRTDSKEQQVRLESDSQLIQVVTIHKSKGLQYPLVFLPFVAYTNPLSSRIYYPAIYHNDQGDIQVAFDDSDPLVAAKLDQERLEEDIRKLYVAVTRAQFATYIGLAPYKTLDDTALSYLLSGGGELDLDQLKLPHECARVDVPELIAQTQYQPPADKSPTFVFCDMPEQHRFERWWVASYSALKYGEWVSAAAVADSSAAQNALEERHDQRPATEQTPEPNTQHSFPKGAEAGTYLHNLLEDAATEGFARLVDDAELRRQFVAQRAQLEPWLSFQNVLDDWLVAILNAPLAAGDRRIRLAELTSYQAEPEFWFPAPNLSAQKLDEQLQRYVMPGLDRPQVLPMQLNGMLKGFIDLVFEFQGQYYVVDYKSNVLGPDDQAYRFDSMRDKILASRYDLQYVIYLVALHKLLAVRLGDNYDYDTHVGGAIYIFLRGVRGEHGGAFYDRPPRELIEALAAQFDAMEEQSC